LIDEQGWPLCFEKVLHGSWAQLATQGGLPEAVQVISYR
jgi:hypothetical protein